MKRDKTVFELIVPFILMVLVVVFASTSNCHGQIRKDYQDHFVIGSFVGFSAAWTQWVLNGTPETKAEKDKLFINGIIWSSAIGIGKELLIDYPQGKGEVEWQDAACTIIGGALGAGVIRVLFIEKKKEPVIFSKGNYKGMVLKIG